MVMARCGEMCLAETLRVPEQYRSIQKAIDQASPSDLVLVQQGRYTERIVMGNGVTVRSAGMNEQGKLGLKRAEDTVIDGGG